jgi:soluble lytic murein transglycosylase-like protein
MAQKAIGTLLMAAALLVGSPALAQDDNLTAMPPESAAAGYRVDGSAGDFQLVTHGVWQAPVQIAGSALIPNQPTGLGPSKQRKIRKAPGTQPSFRRSAYLPHVYAAEAQYGLPTGLLDALIWTESRYNPFAVSGTGAAHLSPGTWTTHAEDGARTRGRQSFRSACKLVGRRKIPAPDAGQIWSRPSRGRGL